MDAEFTSADHEAVAMAARFYAVLKKSVPSSTTLGELMVLTEVALGIYRKTPQTVTEIAGSTGLSRWTVGRIVQRYIEKAATREKKDHADTRRKLLVWTDEAFRLNHKWARDLNRMWSGWKTDD